ncbi:MAG: hypothetical protein AAFP70_12920 [Calditrichota bacterium]
MNNFSLPLLYILAIVLFLGSCSKNNPDFIHFAGEWVGEYRTPDVIKDLEVSLNPTDPVGTNAILKEIGETVSTKELSFDGINLSYEDLTTLTFIRAKLSANSQNLTGEFILGRNAILKG